MNQQRFGERFLLKKVLMQKLLSLTQLKTVISSGFKADEFSFITIKKTGGVVVVVWIQHQLVILAGRIQKFFMISVKKTTTLASVRLIQRVIAVGLWKLAIKFLCSIGAWKMVLLNHSKRKMLILVVAWSELLQQKLIIQMYSKLA